MEVAGRFAGRVGSWTRHLGRLLEASGNGRPRGMVIPRKGTEPGLQAAWLFFHAQIRTNQEQVMVGDIHGLAE